MVLMLLKYIYTYIYKDIVLCFFIMSETFDLNVFLGHEDSYYYI
jgi:hypothetical protein